MHVNPCFFKAFNGKTLTIIAKGEECELNDGDQFSLLPEDCWFRIKVKHEHEGTSPTGVLNSKRSHDSGCEEGDLSKKPRLSTNEDTSQMAELQTSQDDQFKLELNPSQHFIDEEKPNEDTLDPVDQFIEEDGEANTTTENNYTLETSHVVEQQTSQIVTNETAQAEQLELKPISDVKDGPHSDNITTNDQEINIEQPDIKQEPQDGEEAEAPVNGDPNVASGSGSRKTRRERCWYKERCFRSV